MIIYIFMFGFFSVFKSDAYVLLQVKKHDANHSNVDALIHKMVPSNKFDKFSKKMDRNRSKIPGLEEIAQNAAMESRSEEGLAVPVSRDGHSRYDKSRKPKLKKPKPGINKEDSDPSLSELLVGILNKLSRSFSGPVNRARNQDVMLKPRTLHLNSGKSSLYTLNPDTIEVAMKDILSSNSLQKYIDNLTRKAAAMYQTVVTSEIVNKDNDVILFKE